MFNVYLNRVKLDYASCPETGIAAVDWRRAHGLPAAPTNRAGVFDPSRIVSEPLCRLCVGSLDVDANLSISDIAILVPCDLASALLSLPEGWIGNDCAPSPAAELLLARLLDCWKDQ